MNQVQNLSVTHILHEIVVGESRDCVEMYHKFVKSTHCSNLFSKNVDLTEEC